MKAKFGACEITIDQTGVGAVVGESGLGGRAPSKIQKRIGHGGPGHPTEYLAALPISNDKSGRSRHCLTAVRQPCPICRHQADMCVLKSQSDQMHFKLASPDGYQMSCTAMLLRIGPANLHSDTPLLLP